VPSRCPTPRQRGGLPQPVPEPARYTPLGGRARAARTALFVVAALDVVGLVSGLVQLYVLQGIESGELSDGAATANDVFYGGIGIVQLLALITTAVLFLRWFYAAYGNLPLLSAGSPRFKRGWAIGAWFVPILNLFRPKQIANDIWRGSDPRLSPEASPDWSGGSLPGLYALWWGGWIVDNFLDNLAFRLTLRAEEFPELYASAYAYLAADAIEIPLAFVAAAVVSRTTRRQEERAAAMSSGAAPEPSGQSDSGR